MDSKVPAKKESDQAVQENNGHDDSNEAFSWPATFVGFQGFVHCPNPSPWRMRADSVHCGF